MSHLISKIPQLESGNLCRLNLPDFSHSHHVFPNFYLHIFVDCVFEEPVPVFGSCIAVSSFQFNRTSCKGSAKIKHYRLHLKIWNTKKIFQIYPIHQAWFAFHRFRSYASTGNKTFRVSLPFKLANIDCG